MADRTDFRWLLVSGCYRSGTTLLEKVLHSHPQICVASQPLPIVYFYAKSAFLNSRNLARRYPLDHLFLEEGYTADDFCRFLSDYELSHGDLDDIFAQLADYKLGLWTPQVLTLRPAVRPGKFYKVYAQLLRLLAELLGKPSARYAGSKEVLSEEYVPFLLSHGVRVLLSVRDPRDMITSLNFRERDNQTGEHRPILYSLRAWRKSVAFALGYENHPGCYWHRYEDFVRDPRAVTARLSEFLGVTGFPESEFAAGIPSQEGGAWKGNSSFADFTGISDESVGRSAEHLPESVREFVETTCYPEMQALGYDVDIDPADAAAILGAFRDPFERIHEKFPQDYSFAPSRVADEVRRLELVLNPAVELGPREAARWFLHQQAYHRLRGACAAAM